MERAVVRISQENSGLRQIVARSGVLIQILAGGLKSENPDHIFLNPDGGVITEHQLKAVSEFMKGKFKEVLGACETAIDKKKQADFDEAEKKGADGEKSAD